MNKPLLPASLHAARPVQSPVLVDPYGRRITYLRLSITDRCDLRCTYCMAEHMVFLPKRDVLSFEEMERLVAAFVAMGLKKLRITGGEPLVRRGAMEFITRLSRFLRDDGLAELTLTTNGTQLAQYAQALARAGVKRINVSLDTLDPDRFRAVTRLGALNKVLAGLDAAQQAGLAIKINTVALKSVNADEIIALTRFAHGRDMDIAFIEVMPMGETGEDRLDQYLPLTDVRAVLKSVFTLERSAHTTGGPARYDLVKETGRFVGFITPHTHNFCENCNRVRVTCTGTLYPCLGQDNATDLRPALRASIEGQENRDALVQTLRQAIAHKPKGHDFIMNRAALQEGRGVMGRHMSVTGG